MQINSAMRSLLGWIIIKNQKKIMIVSQNMDKLEPLYTGGNVKWGSHYGKQYGAKPPYDPEIPLLGIHPEETKIEKDTCTTVFTAALFTIARIWKPPRCPLTDEWIKEL